MKLTILVVNLFLFNLQVNSEEKVKITYESLRKQRWDFVGTLLTCITGNETRILTQNSTVFPHHNSPIESIYIDNPSEIKFIPKNLKTIFPKLQMLVFDSQPITTLSSSDLEQFGDDLTLFDLDQGMLTFLKKDLFTHNRNLKHINFFGNPLKFIEPGFFDNIAQLNKLQFINLENCSCIDQAKFGIEIKRSIWIHSCGDRNIISDEID